MIYPIVEYAHLINKNTADFTASDMGKFMKWWIKQPDKEERERGILNQLQRVNEIHNEIKTFKKEDIMGKSMNTKKFQDAQMSRLNGQNVQEVVGEIEEMEGVEMEEETQEEIVCNLGLTKLDVTALLFCISQIFEDYEMTEHKYEASLLSVKEGLESVIPEGE